MIRINLLPDEFRRASRTPARTLGLLGCTSVVSFGALAILAYLFFSVRADAANRVAIAQEQLDNLTPQARYSETLEKEKDDYERRNKTIQEIAASRILWTRKLDRLSAIVNQDVTSGRHMVWLESMDIDSKVGSRSTGGISFKGFSATSNLENVSNFHEDLKDDAVFARGFASFSAPKSRREAIEEELVPPEKLSFSFEVKLAGTQNSKK